MKELLATVESHLKGGGAYTAEADSGSFRVRYMGDDDLYILTGTVSGGPANVMLAPGLMRHGDRVTATSVTVGEMVRNMAVCAPLEKWELLEDSGAAQRSSAEGE